MRPLFLLLSLVGCSSLDSSSTLSAGAELLLSTMNGAEEAMAARASYGGMPGSEDPDQPPLFRECDAEGTYTGLFERYDTDHSERLDDEERADVESAHAGRDDMERRMADMRWRLMLLVYDTDEDGALSDAETEPLFEDFTTRCEVLHDKLIEDFDADGDGELSDEELATAEETMRAEMEARRAEMEEHRGEFEDHGPPPEPGSREVPPGLEGFDTDSDGLLSDAELLTLREELRARIRDGEPPVEHPEE